MMKDIINQASFTLTIQLPLTASSFFNNFYDFYLILFARRKASSELTENPPTQIPNLEIMSLVSSSYIIISFEESTGILWTTLLNLDARFFLLFRLNSWFSTKILYILCVKVLTILVGP